MSLGIVNLASSTSGATPPRVGKSPVAVSSWDIPESFLIECRALAAALRVGRGTRASSVLALTAPRAGAGVTTLAWCLARYLARGTGESVLLIDAVPAPRGLAGASENPGFGAVLEGVASLDDVVRPTSEPGLDYLPAGDGGDPGRVDQAERLFADVRARYTHVFIDLPPVLAPGFAESVAQAADAAVLVVEPSADTLDTVEKAVTILRQVTRVLGVVFNRADAG